MRHGRPGAGFAGLLLISALGAPLFAGSIPIIVDRYLPDARPGAPVKFGVPFPQGVLKVGEAVQVADDQGKVLPSQAAVTATWDPKGEKGVRWLLVDFLADEGRQYRLLYGNDLLPKVAPVAPIAKLANDLIELDTGLLTGIISRKKADLFGGLQAMGQPLVVPDAEKRFCAFFVEHETKGLFRSDLDPSPSVVLEENGPIRATVKLDGWYANGAGEKFCRYSIRAHFFRGRSDVKLEHTFIYTGLSKSDRIQSMGLQLPQKAGQRGYFMGEGEVQPQLAMDFTSTGKVVQDSPDHERLELLYYPANGGRKTRLAGRSSGCMSYGQLAVSIRDAWQQYPWGFEVADGAVQVQLWPRGARLLDTRFDGYWWFLDERQKRFMLSTKSKAPADLDAWIARHREAVNATGAAKTHEVWLTFPAPTAVSAGGLGMRLFRETAFPVIACADPAWSTSTRALDFCPHTPRNDKLFGDEERYLDGVLAMAKQITEARGWYGWWDWGGYYQIPGQANTFAYEDSHGLEAWHRNRPKSHYGWGQLPWLQYFRTGDRKWLRYAQTYTLYSADRAFVHHTANGRVTGEEYHYDNSDIPWVGGWQGSPGGAQSASNLQQKDDYVYMYWLTGDRRALDALKEWGEQVQDKPGLFKWAPGFSVGNDIRNAGMQLHRLTMLYQATWDERYLKLARSVADSFAPIRSEAEVLLAEGDRKDPHYNGWRFHTADGWAYEGLWLYYNVTRDDRLKQTLLAFIERSKNFDGGIGWGYGPLRAYTYGYLLTGDAGSLDRVRAICDDVVARWVTPRAWRPDAEKFTAVTLGRALGLMAAAPADWQARMLPTDQRGRTLRFRYAPYANSPSYAPARVFFNKTEDRAWRFTLLFNYGGQWTLRRPDGATAYTSEMFEEPFDKKWLTVEVPADGQKGTYVLECAKPSKWYSENRDPQYMAEARVLHSDLPAVVSLHSGGGATLAVWGRSLFFRASQAPAQVNVSPNTPRGFSVQADGRAVASTADRVPPYDGIFRLPISPERIGQTLELRPDRPGDRYFGDDNTLRAYAGYLWFEGAPPYVAANPEEFFVPEVRK